jgi:hypothetical protein
MKAPSTRKGAFNVVGVGAAACVACCAGPILGLLAATGLFTVAGVAAFGAVGLLVLVPLAIWWNHRRLRAAGCDIADEPVPVELSGRR